MGNKAGTSGRIAGASEVLQDIFGCDKLPFDVVWKNLQQIFNIDSQKELSILLEVSHTAVAKAKAKGTFPLHWVHRLAKKLNTSAGHIITGQSTHKKRDESTEGWIYRVFLERSLSAVEADFEISLSYQQRSALLEELDFHFRQATKSVCVEIARFLLEKYRSEEGNTIKSE